jgi:hypothetical protein
MARIFAYRPNGARYNLEIVWNDVDRKEVVDTSERLIQVAFRQ